MIISVRGGSKSQKDYARSIATFSAGKLMSPQLVKNLDITIQLVKNLSVKEGVYGDCIWEDDDVRPREFIIRADCSLRLRRILETIAHEMVHVKQWAMGEMREMSRPANKTKWKGQLFETEMEYWDRPWEIEAHGREVGLFIRWAETHKLGNRAWTQDS